MTWADMKNKYPEYWDEMDQARERKFVKDCFECYEQEGFVGKFWSCGGDYKEYHGKSYEVIGRVPEYDSDHKDGADLECLPMWKIRFEDGKEIDAYPDELIKREMIDNGCTEDFFN